MEKEVYLIPAVWGVYRPMEYRIVVRKKDMRTKFCKDNEKYRLKSYDAVIKALTYIGTRIKGDRLLMSSGEVACNFMYYVFERRLKKC